MADVAKGGKNQNSLEDAGKLTTLAGSFKQSQRFLAQTWICRFLTGVPSASTLRSPNQLCPSTGAHGQLGYLPRLRQA
jgi:hypothetical protein